MSTISIQPSFQERATRYFQDCSDPSDVQFLRSEVRAFNENRIHEIAELGKRIFSTLVEEVRSVYQPNFEEREIEVLKNELSPEGSFGDRWLFEMYRWGSSSFNQYIRKHVKGNKDSVNIKEIESLSRSWVERVKHDFQEGKLCSFYQMSEWGRRGQIDLIQSLRQENPFDQPEELLVLLRKMAHLGISEAQFALSCAYSENKLDGISFDLPLTDRIEGLKELARLGCQSSASHLVSLYRSQVLNDREVPLSEQDRRQGMEELIEIESQEGFHFSSITLFLAEGGFEELRWNDSLQERIEKIKQRAKHGDAEAFSYMWNLYVTNKFGEEEVDLALNEQERWANLEDLRTEKTEKIYKRHYSDWVANPKELLPCHMSVEERFNYLKEQVFENGYKNVSVLMECYTKNSWEGVQLNISFEDRLKGIESLIPLSGIGPMIVLAKYYVPEIPEIMETLVLEEIQGVPDEARQALEAQSFKERFDYILNLALKGGQAHFIERWLAPNVEHLSLQDVLKYAARHMKIFSRG